MSATRSYDDVRAAWEWRVPARYNIAADVCDKHPRDKPAMLWERHDGARRDLVWGELQDLANQAAHVLRDHGVAKGDRVAVVLPPTPETAAVFLGTWKLGAILLSMSVLYGDDGLRHRVRDSRPKVLVTDRANAPRFAEHADVELLVLDDGLLDGAPTDHVCEDTSADDPAQLYYTSGTTGLAKGILHAHRYVIAHNEFELCHEVQDGERFHGMGEWAWAAGISPLLGPWRLGALQCVLQRQGGFDPHQQLDFLSRHEVTNVFTTPTAMRSMMAIADAGTRYPARFRRVCSAGEPLNPEAIRWFRQQYGLTVLDYYGMTESYPMVANFPWQDVREGSMGKPVPGWDVRILDEDEREVPRGERGEICLRAHSNPHWPLGYWGLPDKTEEDFGGPWFHTGDAAKQDEDGYVWYDGRYDDVIISAGYRIGPFEVESACLEHPAVREAAAVASPDERRGSIVKAFIVLADGHVPSDELGDEIMASVRDRLSAYAYPRRVEFVDELPKTLTGKIRRIELRERERATG
ncbi:acyl-CoA synthetase [Conexibacter sp. SYSU D00693]|uniref:acyl-CoA synthetase n=1 Tax=Conexibacter sp. SYSU D00693 TaxID=2812560 RepID=UPI00196B7806|nr:AMP-binding protein [Conexibacter sp. SYSU D00693]